MYDTIKYCLKEGIAYITLNRPKALNALNNDVLTDLLDIFEKIAKNDNVKAVIVTGEGRAFAAGADLVAINQMNTVEGRQYSANGHQVMNFIESLEKPVIAAVNGYALGGGCELAMACDIRVASVEAKFGQPEVNLGLIPGFGGTQRLPKFVGKGMAKYLILTGEMIDAEEAQRIGLVEKVVTPEHLIEEAEKVANTIMLKAPIAISSAINAINKGEGLSTESGSALEIEAFTGPFASEDIKEGIAAFFEKRKAHFKKK